MMFRVVCKQNGSVMSVALMFLCLLSLIVIYLNRASVTNLKIATYDKQNKTSFHNADGGTEMGSMLIEENISCANGFAQNPAGSGQTKIGFIKILDTEFWKNPFPPEPTDAARHIYYPLNYTGSEPHTNITLGGETRVVAGSASPMVTGYEGVGRASGAGGSYIQYDIWAQHIGKGNSMAKIKIAWKHVIGLEGPCNY